MAEDTLTTIVITIPPTIAALSAAYWGRRNGKSLRGNGQGTHTEMLERTLGKVDDLGATFHAHVAEDRQVAQELRDLHASTMSRLDDVVETQNSIIRKVL